jgi:hypothetical protein
MDLDCVQRWADPGVPTTAADRCLVRKNQRSKDLFAQTKHPLPYEGFEYSLHIIRLGDKDFTETVDSMETMDKSLETMDKEGTMESWSETVVPPSSAAIKSLSA